MYKTYFLFMCNVNGVRMFEVKDLLYKFKPSLQRKNTVDTITSPHVTIKECVDMVKKSISKHTDLQGLFYRRNKIQNYHDDFERSTNMLSSNGFLCMTFYKRYCIYLYLYLSLISGSVQSELPVFCTLLSSCSCF